VRAGLLGYMRGLRMIVISQLAGLASINLGVFLLNIPAGFIALGLTGVLIGITLERIDAG
jgi:hypothetical protein